MDEAQRILENRNGSVPEGTQSSGAEEKAKTQSPHHLQAESELERTPAAQGPVDLAAKEIKVSKIPENQLPKPTGTL